MGYLEFKNKKDGSAIYVYNRGLLQWFWRFTVKRQHLKRAEEYGPFASKGDALLNISMSTDKFKFSEFEQKGKS